MREIIIERLREIEREEGVRILYACESGSRAWGFPSADSDYDVRFIYAHPRDWYLSVNLEKKRDVIERPINDELDISGWDVRKALQLFYKSNPPLLEWLGSPIVYLERGETVAKMRELAKTFYSPKASMYHYLHMARGNYREYLRGEEVWLKKYFYALRPILAINWLERGLGVVPTEFQKLVDAVVEDDQMRTDIDRLLIEKRAGNELKRGSRIDSVSGFLDSEIKRLEGRRFQDAMGRNDVEPLNQLFRAALTE